MKRFATSCIAIFLFTNLAIAQQVARMSAIEIMDRVTKVYASCSAYMDEGQLQTKDLFGVQVDRRSFTTVFVRPSHFRFEESSFSYGSKERNHFIALEAGEQGSVWPRGMH